MPQPFKHKTYIGQEFDRLTVIGLDRWYSIVRCNCSDRKIKKIRNNRLISGEIRSCGCIRREYMANKQTTHGCFYTKLHSSYRAMINRCYHESSNRYDLYGGRGIITCQDWNPFLLGWEKAFCNFKYWADRNGHKEGLSIDRIDNDNIYCPNNCRWIERKNQSKYRRCVTLYTYNGICKNLSEWSKDPACCVSIPTLRKRIKAGWSIEDALTRKP